jgi:hypothetical protein
LAFLRIATRTAEADPTGASWNGEFPAERNKHGAGERAGLCGRGAGHSGTTRSPAHDGSRRDLTSAGDSGRVGRARRPGEIHQGTNSAAGGGQCLGRRPRTEWGHPAEYRWQGRRSGVRRTEGGRW